ncbi:MAG: hypothetical protein KDB84_06130, partial [Flavobacteriales bacterium]|nr:hypothetical protein [Flavobacteriales bacterium]
DETLEDKVRITVIATGFSTHPDTGVVSNERNTRTVIPLDADRPTMITQPIVNPVQVSAPPAPEPPPAVEEPYLKQVEAEPVPVPMKNDQRTIEFTIEDQVTRPAEAANGAQEKEEIKRHTLYDDDVPASAGGQEVPRTQVQEARLSPGEHQSRVEQRVAQVRELNMRLRTPSGLNDLEREPAYKRKNIQLNDATPSTDSNVSRYTLNEEVDEHGERRVELKRNNPYLHDNVD